MIREEMKKALPAFKAYADGKIIQLRKKGAVKWVDFLEDDIVVSQYYEYRIKPESKYRPFKSVKECLAEMLRHSDIGYIRYKSDGKKEPFKVGPINIDYRYEHKYGYEYECCGYDLAFGMFTFTDGEPFGIKEE